MGQENQKGYTSSIFVIIFLVLVLVGGAYFLIKARNNKPDTQPVETRESQDTNKPTFEPLETENWQTYTNTKYGYSLQYPPDLPAYNGLAVTKKDITSGMDTADKVIFGCDGFGEGVCLTPFEAGKSTLKEIQLIDIFNLKIGEEVDQELTYALGGRWNQKTNYKRLDDQIVDNTSLLVLDNPNGYGGSNRIWFVKKDDVVLQFNCIYTNQDFLTKCQTIISTIKLN